MRYFPPRQICRGIVLASLLVGCSSAERDAPTLAACDVAVAFMQEHARREDGRDMVVMGGPQAGRLLLSSSLEPLQRQFGKDPPPLSLLGRLNEPSRGVIAECPSLAEFLREKGIRSGEAAANEVVGAMSQGGEYPADILTLRLPVVDDNGGHALVAIDWISGNEAAVGVIYHFRRQSTGSWRQVDETGTWIS